MKFFLIPLAFSTICFSATCRGAEEVPVPRVGQPLPYFQLQNVRHFPVTTVTPQTFHGKWLVLDFWSSTCSTCIPTFPKLDNLQREIGNNLQFFLVGIVTSDNPNAPQVFERARQMKKFDLPVAFDSLLFRAWNINTVPHMFIVDPQGVVRFIATGRDLTSEKLKALIRGDSVVFSSKQVGKAPRFELQYSTSSQSATYAAVLCNWNGEHQESQSISDFSENSDLVTRGWTIAGAPLFWLYNHAYLGKDVWGQYDSMYGKVSVKPVLEVKDTSPFEFSFGENGGQSIYNFFGRLPAAQVSADRMKGLLQNALHDTFSYQVSIEIRERPVWKLHVDNNKRKKLRAKGDDSYMSDASAGTGFTLRNQPISALIRGIQIFLPNEDFIPIIDDTGLAHSIDIELVGDMTSWEGVQAALGCHGLRLDAEFIPMKTLVIRDAE